MAEVNTAGIGFEENVDEYISEGIFFVPETARWSVIARRCQCVYL